MGVVIGAFGRMREDFVSFDDFTKAVGGGSGGGMVVVGRVIWMVLFYELKVARFDFLLGCAVREGKDFVGGGVGRVSWPGDVALGCRVRGRGVEEARGGGESWIVYSRGFSLTMTKKK